MDLQNKRVLITQNNLSDLAGSEIVTLELSEFFTSRGAQATVYTYGFGEPISEEFSKLPNVKVVTNIQNDLSFSDFDIVWVHHQILPINMFDELASGCKIPVVVFNHMSTIAPLELPHLNGLEKTLASLILFNSFEGRRRQKHYFADIPSNLLLKRDDRPRPLVHRQFSTLPTGRGN